MKTISLWMYVGIFVLMFSCAIIISWFCNGLPSLGIDDAHIFFNYAENIAKGWGVTYSNNGIPVEGCTSLLWMLICAFNFYVGGNETGVFICTLLCLLAAQVYWFSLIQKLANDSGSTVAMALYSMLILSSPGYITWMSLTLMDISLWGLFVAWLTNVLYDVLNEEKVTRCTKIGFMVLPIVRPESYFVMFMFFVLLCVFRRRSFKSYIDCGLLFAAAVVALTVFRLWYFGYPLPNTYYAKVSPSLLYNIKNGLIYAGLFVSAGLVSTAFAIGSFFVAKTFVKFDMKSAFRMQPFQIIWLWCLILMVIPVLTGGDHFELHRFYQPFYPLICVLLSVGVMKSGLLNFLLNLSGMKSLKLFLVLIGGAIILFGWSGRGSWLFAIMEGSSLRHEFSIAEEGRKDGSILNRLFQGIGEYPVVGTITAGGVARTYKGKIVDVMGLNDLRVAHFPGDRKGMKNHAAFEPDVFNQLGCDALRALPIDNVFLKDLTVRADFVHEWRCVKISLKNDPMCAIVLLIKNDLLNRIHQAGRCQVQDVYVWNGMCWMHV